jgi:hypothetical protein
MQNLNIKMKNYKSKFKKEEPQIKQIAQMLFRVERG